MKVILFSQEDPFYVRVFFETFLEIYDRSDQIQAVVISRPMGKRSAAALAGQMYGFYGPWDFIRMGIRYAGAKAAARGGDWLCRITGRQPVPTTIGQLVRSHGIPIIECDDLNSEAFREKMKGLAPDLFVSIASPVIFKEDLLEIPAVCAINIHNAPLPRYRGMLPNFWQLFHGEGRTGITVHRMVRSIDGGDIIRQEFLPVAPGESLDALIRRTKKRNAILLKQVLDDFRKGSVTFTPMVGEGSYFTFPTKAEVQEFKRRGGRLL